MLSFSEEEYRFLDLNNYCSQTRPDTKTPACKGIKAANHKLVYRTYEERHAILKLLWRSWVSSETINSPIPTHLAFSQMHASFVALPQCNAKPLLPAFVKIPKPQNRRSLDSMTPCTAPAI